MLSGTGDDTRVTWPSGLVSDPKAWLEHAAGDLATVVPGLVDAAAGLLQTGGAPPPGTLPLTDGVSLRTSSAGGRLAMALAVDATQFAGGLGDLVLQLSAGAGFAVGGSAAALPELSVDVGAAGVGALRVRVGTDAGGADGTLGVTLSLIPDSRPEIVLYPAARGLAGLADAAAAGAVAALPPLLTRLAAEDPADPAPATTAEEVAGRIVARAGRALGLATGTPAVFDKTALSDFAANPAVVFEARAAGIAAEGLALVVDAVEAVLGSSGTRSVTSSAGRVALTIGPATERVTLGWNPGAGSLDAAVTVSGLAGVGSVTGSVTISGNGIDAVDVAVGPAQIPVGDTVTLAPYARIAAGSTRPGPTVDVGLGAGGDTRLLVRFASTGGGLDVTALSSTGAFATPLESSAPEDVALAVVATLLDIAGAVVLGISEVQTALGQTALGTSSVADLLDGVVLTTGPLRLDAGLVDSLTSPDALLRRLALLVGNVADAMPAALSIGGVLDVRVTSSGPAANRLLGLTVAVTGDEWILNPGGDVQVGLVSDASWIAPPEPPGITLEAVRLTAASVEPAPGLIVGGVGVRFSRASGPLLDAGLTIDAASLLGFGLISSTGSGVELGGGARVEIAGIGMPLGGGGDGATRSRRGSCPQAAAGDDAPAPRFSPAVARAEAPRSRPRGLARAGTGGGPWWLPIQREFGPVYLEQVGFGVTIATGHSSSAIVAAARRRGSRCFGLTAAVDELSLTLQRRLGRVAVFDPRRWAVDLAGFAITADIGGLALAGGLRKFTPRPERGIEYVGMLLGRLRRSTALSVFGGYGHRRRRATIRVVLRCSARSTARSAARRRSSSPASAAASASTAASSSRPTSSQFGKYPFIQALDPARAAPATRWPSSSSSAATSRRAGQVLVRGRHLLHMLRARRRRRRRRRRSSATASRSTCSAWPGWRCRDRRSRWSRSSSACSRGSRPARACS